MTSTTTASKYIVKRGPEFASKSTSNLLSKIEKIIQDKKLTEFDSTSNTLFFKILCVFYEISYTCNLFSGCHLLVQPKLKEFNSTSNTFFFKILCVFYEISYTCNLFSVCQPLVKPNPQTGPSLNSYKSLPNRPFCPKLSAGQLTPNPWTVCPIMPKIIAHQTMIHPWKVRPQRPWLCP